MVWVTIAISLTSPIITLLIYHKGVKDKLMAREVAQAVREKELDVKMDQLGHFQKETREASRTIIRRLDRVERCLVHMAAKQNINLGDALD